MINVKDYGAIGNGVADDTAALQEAINEAYVENTSLFIPGGTYLVSSSLIIPFDSSAVMNKGNYIYGEGMLRTVVKAASPNVILFKYEQPSPLKFMLGGQICNMTLDGNQQPGSVGIQLQAVFSHMLFGLQITRFTNGVNIMNTVIPGDYDASNHVAFDMCRIENCAHWGVFLAEATGNNETSFLSLRNTTIEGCGTTTGAVGGGMYWRGQMLQFDNSAFVANKNRGLYIEGGAGLGSNILGNNLTFENNTSKHLECWGVTGMEFNNLQLYSNDANVAQYGLYLNGSSSLLANVRVNSAKVRASAGNTPYYAFVAAGTHASTTTIVADSKQIRWDDFGHPGQVQYSGWTVV
jgi:hypothetical protein